MESRGAEAVGQQENKKKIELSNEKKKSRRKKKRYSWIPRFPCARLDDDVSDVGGFDVTSGEDQSAKHLIVMVNGIIGSAQNWRYAAKQFVKVYPSEVLVHLTVKIYTRLGVMINSKTRNLNTEEYIISLACRIIGGSESNSSMLTLDGVDVMGKRLADEVISVVGRHSDLEKISFVGHSLGGLVARYAVAVLYEQDLTRKAADENGECGEDKLSKSPVEEKSRGKIAGLEPMNFITCATPHLGARGHRQIPVLCGFHSLEKAARRASSVLRMTGKHLYLRDNDNGNPPLLLQMADDTDDLKFISALVSFRRRVAYANTSFDSLVGWSSSSLRRPKELPKTRNLVKNAKYSYIFDEDKSRTAKTQVLSSETKVSRQRINEMEEAMTRGLTRLSWERVDVDFSKSIQGLLSAHTTIQVKTYCINSHGASVIQHMIDNFQL